MLYPFHFTLDMHGMIGQLGGSLSRIVPELSIGTDPGPILMLRSESLTRTILLRHVGKRIGVEPVNCSGVSLRGYVAYDEQNDNVIVLAQPWCQSLEALRDAGLQISDFGPDDPLIDHLVAHQTMQNSLRDAEVLANRLSDANAAQKQYLRELRVSLGENQEARRLAEAANDAKMHFLANISHEIRTPASAVLGYLQCLADPRLPLAERALFVERGQRNGEQLIHLLTQLIDLSGADQARIDVDLEPTNPRQIADDAIALCQEQATEKNLTVRLHVDSSVPRLVRTDSAKIRQILTNLVENAVKFTEVGSVDVSVWFDPSPNRPILKLEVADTGGGIPASLQHHVFEPFAQNAIGLTRENSGVGLGLAICRRLVQALEGEIAFICPPMEGTTFSVNIPVHAVGQSLMKRPDPITHRSNQRRNRGTVLLVVDCMDLSLLYEWWLHQIGCEVLLAPDGHLALQLLERAEDGKDPVDLIVMDMELPTMSGAETARRIRATGFAPPIVALAGQNSKTATRRARSAGCTHHLTKPTGREDIQSIVTRLLPDQKLRLLPRA